MACTCPTPRRACSRTNSWASRGPSASCSVRISKRRITRSKGAGKPAPLFSCRCAMPGAPRYLPAFHATVILLFVPLYERRSSPIRLGCAAERGRTKGVAMWGSKHKKLAVALTLCRLAAASAQGRPQPSNRQASQGRRRGSDRRAGPRRADQARTRSRMEDGRRPDFALDRCPCAPALIPCSPMTLAPAIRARSRPRHRRCQDG